MLLVEVESFLDLRFLFGIERFRLLGIVWLEARNSGVGIDKVSM